MTTPQTPPTPEQTNPTPTPPAEDEKKESKFISFFEHIGTWIKEHLGSAATFEHAAATAINVVKPLLTELLILSAGEPTAAKVSGIVTQVTNDLNDTSALLSGAAAPGGVTLDSLLSSVQSNLGTLLTDADIKNSSKAEEIQGIANTVIGEIEAIAKAIPKAA